MKAAKKKKFFLYCLIKTCIKLIVGINVWKKFNYFEIIYISFYFL